MVINNYKDHSQSPKVVKRTSTGSTKDIINVQPPWFITTPILSILPHPPPPPQNNNNKKKMYETWKCSDVRIDGVPG